MPGLAATGWICAAILMSGRVVEELIQRRPLFAAAAGLGAAVYWAVGIVLWGIGP